MPAYHSGAEQQDVPDLQIVLMIICLFGTMTMLLIRASSAALLVFIIISFQRHISESSVPLETKIQLVVACNIFAIIEINVSYVR